jgi:hypothetical protein
MKISQGIKEVEKSAGPIVNTLLTLGVGILAIGVLAGVAISGSISMPAAIVTFLNGTWLTDIISVFTSSTTALVTVVSLIVVAVLYAMFGLGKKKEGSRM